MEQITLNHISVGGVERDRLVDVHTTVHKGDFILLLGANGAGKSTLLDAMASMVQLKSGNVVCDACVVNYIPQAPERMLFGQALVDEVAFHLSSDSRKQLQHWSDAQAHLAQFGLPAEDPQANPLTWSTGMMRRLVMAMCLLNHPEIILIDEPSAGIDESNTAFLLNYLKLARENGTTVILSTHHLDTFAACANRIWLLQEGKLVYDGLPDDVYARSQMLTDAGIGLPASLRLQMTLLKAGIVPHTRMMTPSELAATLVQPNLPSREDGTSIVGDAPVLAISSDGDGRLASRPTNNTRAELSRGDHVSKHTAQGSQRNAPDDPRWILFTTTLLAITLASFHPLSSSVVGICMTFVILIWTRTGIKSILRWTLPWALFTLFSVGVAGTNIHALWDKEASLFDWHTAWATCISILPYWCYLQLGQVLMLRMSALELEGMIDWLLQMVRVKASVRRVITLTGGMVFRFLPAIAQMFREQMRAVEIRSLSVPAQSRRQPQRRRTTLQRAVSILNINDVLTPLIIRLIRYGETTASALEVRHVLTRPMSYDVFVRDKMDRRSVLFAFVGVASSVLVVISGLWQLHMFG